jgi:hypothetical protein
VLTLFESPMMKVDPIRPPTTYILPSISEGIVPLDVEIGEAALLALSR